MIELDDTIAGVGFKAHKTLLRWGAAVVQGLVESGLWPAINVIP